MPATFSSLSAAHASGCTCDLCTGPAVWNTLFSSSLPPPPPDVPDHAGACPRAIEEQRRQQAEAQRKASWLRLPKWLFPTTRAEANVSKDVESGSSSRSRLVVETILTGQTRSPITLDDLRAFLRSSNRSPELTALDFLTVFTAYKTAFFALPPSEQAPHPYTVIENLAMLGVGNTPPKVPPKDVPPSPLKFNTVPVTTPSPTVTVPPPVATSLISFGRLRRGTNSTLVSFPLNRQPARARAATFSSTGDDDDNDSQKQHKRKPSNLQSFSPHLLDPVEQPMRRELQLIVDDYLSGPSSRMLMAIVTSTAISLALSETELTTHPSTLEPIATALSAHLNTRVLPEFFNAAVINLSRETSKGRLLMASLVLSIAVILTAVFVALPQTFPRWSRLALTPLYLISIGYAIGSQTSLCFWLAWRGTREAKQYEEVEQAAIAEIQFRSHSVADWDPETATLHRTFSDETAVNRHSIHTINVASPSEKVLAARAAAVADVEKGSDLATTTSREKSGKQVSFHPMVDVKRSKRERMLRMTGTATSTVKVEDKQVRRAQVRIAINVTLLLFVGTAAVMTVVLIIP
ncbi:hypothetical protein FRB99_001659 [Tulasnella sp. 403]|nr:hypothetical protein FRB99_001659 [Tulasnella sp. 403]